MLQSQHECYASPVSFLQIEKNGSGHAFTLLFVYISKKSMTDLFHITHIQCTCTLDFLSVDDNFMGGRLRFESMSATVLVHIFAGTPCSINIVCGLNDSFDTNAVCCTLLIVSHERNTF